MKKYIKPFIYIVITIAVITGLSIIAVIQYNIDNKEVELTEFGETTFEFTGDSNHYAFNTGLVFFNENKFESIYKQKIQISDFKQTSSITDITSEKLTIYFNNEVWKKVVRKIDLNELHETIQEYSFEEEILREKSKKKKDTAFTNVTKENFIKYFKMEMEYCTLEEGCETEVFTINYKKGE